MLNNLDPKKKLILWLCFLVMAFIAGTGTLLSILPPPPQLKIETSPPGYPPHGGSWKIIVWEYANFGWVKSSNSSVILYTEKGHRYIFYTNIEGEVEIDYFPEYGKVKIEAVKEGFQGDLWIPADHFIELNIALFFCTSFIGISGIIFKIIYGFFNFERRLSTLFRLIGYTIIAVHMSMTFLVSKWLWANYRISQNWGFHSVICGPIEFNHLLILFLILVLLLVVFYALGSWKKWRNILKEEWNYLECKISILLTLIVLSVILIVIFTDYTLQILPVYSYVLTTFATLLAIVPTVSLTVIGISTSGYSIKLAKIYQRNTYFWYLLLVYVVIILMSMFCLTYPNMATHSLNTVILILSLYGITYLIPYFLAMMRLLDPKKAIEKLGQQINPYNIISIMKHKSLSLIPPPEDPIFPLMEISVNAIEKKDIGLLQLALVEIVKRYEETLTFFEKLRPPKESPFGGVAKEVIITSKMREIIDHYMNHLRELPETALRERYERAMLCIIDYFKDFAQHTMKYRFIEAFRGDSLPSFQWIYEIFKLGEECLLLSFWDGAAASLRALSNLSEIALRHKYYDLHHGIARCIKDLSSDGMKSSYLPRYFLPGVSLHSMSDCVQSRMKYGIYDFTLAMQIENMHQLSFDVIKKGTFNVGQLLSRCYEKLLAVAMFDYYVSKDKKPESVAEIIWRTFPFAFQYREIFYFLVQDRSKQKIRFIPSEYSPEKAFRDLLIHGLGENAKQAVILESEICASGICSSLLEISRVYYELGDEELIKETCKLLKEIYLSAKDPEKIRNAHIPAKLFSIGFACIHKGFDSAAAEAISCLKSLAIFVAKQLSQFEESMKIAFFIEFCGAAAIDIKKTNLAAEAIDATIEFEEEYVRNRGSLPQKNHVTLLIQKMKEIELYPWRDSEYSIKEEKAWLYRLLGAKINFEKPLINTKALDDFYTLYLFRKLPLCS